MDIVILVALLLLPRGKSFGEPSSLAAHANDTATSCIAGERTALVYFKAGLSDPAKLLSSWWGDDCCKWKGVHCSSRNSYVVKLDLPGHGCEPIDYTQVLGGSGEARAQILWVQCLVYSVFFYNKQWEMLD